MLDSFAEKDYFMQLIFSAVDRLYKNDEGLLCSERAGEKLYERALAFRVGHYLQNVIDKEESKFFERCSVDMEYERSIYDQKIAFKECKECKKVRCVNSYDIDNILNNQQKKKNTKIRPDIIVHERRKYNNVFVIEIKTGTNNLDYDKAKLRFLTCESGKYKYKLGVSVLLNKAEATYECFEWDCADRIPKNSVYSNNLN